jgi:hypothetical protein
MDSDSRTAAVRIERIIGASGKGRETDADATEISVIGTIPQPS